MTLQVQGANDTRNRVAIVIQAKCRVSSLPASERSRALELGTLRLLEHDLVDERRVAVSGHLAGGGPWGFQRGVFVGNLDFIDRDGGVGAAPGRDIGRDTPS